MAPGARFCIMKGSVKEARLNFGDRFLRVFSWLMVHLVHRPKVYGPKPVLDKPTIFVCRHVGMMDAVILMVEYYDMMLRPLAAQDYFEKNAFTRWFYPHAQCIPIDRINHSPQWLDDSAAALGRGESVIIFPEGRRNKTGDGLMEFRTGAVRLAVKTGAQVIPVYNAFWKFPHRYRLAIGEPYHIPEVPEGGVTHEWLRGQADDMHDRVAALGKLVEG